VKYTPHDYQTHALGWLLRRVVVDHAQGSGLFLDPGLGKTVITLTWLQHLREMQLAKRALVIAPLRVCYSVWPAEIAKWNHIDLSCAIVHGNPKQRAAAINAGADVSVINPEGIPWLVRHPSWVQQFDTLIVDESSKFKNWGAKRTRALRKMLPGFRNRLILTGTPAPNNLQDLFAQIFITDLGDSLGRNITQFRNRWFYRGGYQGYEWIPFTHAQEEIEKKIQYLVLRMSAEDHLDLPELLINDIWVDLPEDLLAQYKKLERELFTLLESGDQLTPANAGAKYNLCRQYANGGVYVDGTPQPVHRAKVDAVLDLIGELQGKPVLICTQYRHDVARLRTVLPKLPVIDGSTSGSESTKLIGQWNAGKLPLLAVQPQSMSHGINMQSGPGRDMIWLGLTDNLETYLQMIARLYRQGVSGQVRIHRILANGTVDLAVRNRLESKDASQKALLDALNSYKEGSHGSSTDQSRQYSPRTESRGPLERLARH
jgi:SNF2 family DNA or RNA helicase